MDINEKYMRRALELAARGRGSASPNPMVGAVIVAPDGRIIGEGWHRRCGQAHAEVNAVNSITATDRKLLPLSTIYVTLEPCAHYGKTPPCATMLVREGIRRVIIASVDPFAKVDGRGIAILRESGAEVVSGVLNEEARRLNAKFFTAHTHHRPWITLKWAQSADGWLDYRRQPDENPALFSTPLSAVAVHRLRASHDAIAVGARTLFADHPKLTLRLWPGKNPQRIIFDTHGTLILPEGFDALVADLSRKSLLQSLNELYSRGISSLLVEGGARTLEMFISSGIWDAARVETSTALLGDKGRARAPEIGHKTLGIEHFDQNMVRYYFNNPLADVKNL